MNDIEQLLNEAGIEWRKGKMDCPECGERKVTASPSKGIVKCWGCQRFWSARTTCDEYTAQNWATWLVGEIASHLRKNLTERTTTYDWLTVKRNLPVDVAWLQGQDLGSVDDKVDYAQIAKEASNRLEAAAVAGMKTVGQMTTGRDSALLRAENLYDDQRTALKHLTRNILPMLSQPFWKEAVTYLYRNANGEPISINIRQFMAEPDERRILRIQPFTGERGVFDASDTVGPGWGEDAPCLVVVEGEHNLLTLRAAIRGWGANKYALPVLAVGGKNGADVNTIKDLAGGGEPTIIYDFDKVDLETGKPGGYAMVEAIRQQMYLHATHTGPDAKDLDDFLQADPSRDRFLNLVLRRKKHVTIPFYALAAHVDKLSTHRGLAPRLRSREIQNFVLEHTDCRAKIYSVDGYAAIVTRNENSGVTEIIPARKGNPAFLQYLSNFGLTPADRYIDEIGQCFGAIAASLTTPRNTLHSLAHFDGTNLYLNTYAGQILKISPGSDIKLVPNGTDSILMQQFATGADDTHTTVRPWMPPREELQALLDASPNAGMHFRQGDLLDRHILSLVEYEGDSTTVKQLLKCWLLSLFFASSMRSKPIPMFEGPPGAGKSAVASRIGELIIGPRFAVSNAPTNARELAEMMTGIPFIVFDEWNEPSKDVEAGIKYLTTGGRHKRRELYTTSNMVELSCDASVCITTNASPLRTEATSRRLLTIRVAARQKQVGDKVFQSVGAHLLPQFMRIRPQLWTLLVGDLAACVDALHETDPATLTSFSMGDFGAFVARIASFEGWGKEAEQMFAATAHRQEDQASQSNMLVRLLTEYFATSKDQVGKYLHAADWIDLLLPVLGQHDREGRAKLTTHYFGQVAKINRTLLEHRLGMQSKYDPRSKSTRYAFTPAVVDVSAP